MKDWPDFSYRNLPADVQAHIDLLEARVTELEEGLLADFEPEMQVAFGLSPKQSRLLGVLARRQQVSKDMAMAVLYGGETDPPSDKILDVFICKIRRAIAPNYRIKTIFGVGWFMPADQRAELRERFVAPAVRSAA